MNLGVDIEQLRRKCFDNETLVLKLIDRFQAGFETTLSALNQSFLNHDFERLQKLSHHLAGEAGTMCAPEIHALAKNLWSAAGNQSGIELEQYLADLADLKLEESLYGR